MKSELDRLLALLVVMKRERMGQSPSPSVAVIDSQSVRLGLPHSEAGIDGGKRVKGIKRQLAVERNGFPLGVDVARANVRDSKGASRLIYNILSRFPGIGLIKADMGYRGAFSDMPLEELGVRLDCVKSNYGTSGFQPIDGRWVVERTISWSQTYRRLMRNYERYLSTARAMAMFAFVFFMLRYFE